MAKDDKFFSELIREIGIHLFVAAPARVIKVNGNHSADIKPLYKTKDDTGTIEEHPSILEAPILKHVGIVNPGDVVWVNFGDRALDNMSGNYSFDPGFTRLHSINDAVIVGIFQV